LHALTWTVWMLAAAACVQLAPSPVYVTVVIFVSVLVVEVHGRRSALARAFPLMVMLASAFGLVRVLITALTTHSTGDVVLLTIPVHVALPNWLGGFTIGGTVERGPVLQSLADAYWVVGFVTVFAAWNAVVSHHEVLRAVPRAFHEPALVVTVAIAFVPSTIAAVRDARLAERARCGMQPRRRGRLRRLVIPVFEGGIERAINLAESMDSRGLGHGKPERAEAAAGWSVLLALLAFTGGFVALVSNATTAAYGAFTFGAVAFGAAVVVASRGHRRARYRPRPIKALDVVVIAGALLTTTAAALLASSRSATLHWSSFAPLHAPTIDLTMVAVFASLAFPVLATWTLERVRAVQPSDSPALDRTVSAPA
jgi:energy-coupling factor transport system permease protein